MKSSLLLLWLLTETFLAQQSTAQETTTVGVPCANDLTFVIDESGSIRDNNVDGEPDNWGLMIDFVEKVIEQLDVGPSATHVAVVRFGNEAYLDFNLTQHMDQSSLFSAMELIRNNYRGGNTNTTGGLRVMRTQVLNAGGGNRPDTANICVLITDGAPTREVDGLMPEVNLNKESLGVKFITVGVTNRINVTLLQMIASPPISRNYLSVTDFNKLNSSLPEVITAICTPGTAEPSLTSASTTPAVVATSSSTAAPAPLSTPSSTSTTTRVTTPTTTSTTTTTPTTTSTSTTRTTTTTTTTTPRPTTTTTTTPTTTRTTLPPVTGCRNGADLVFAIDSSAAMPESNFQTVRQFLADLVVDLSIDNGNIRVGLVTYAASVVERFSLNRYSTRDDVRAAILSTPYTVSGGPATGTHVALTHIRYNMLVPGSNGDRADVPDLIILITGAQSSNMQQSLEQASRARQAGIHIIAVGIGNWLNLVELAGIASYPYQSERLTISNIGALASYRTQFKDKVCNNINECSSNPCQNGGICEDRIDSYICKCSAGYSGVNCEQVCRVGIDLAILVDESNNLSPAYVQMEIDFIFDVVLAGLSLDSSSSRLALVMYADNELVQFYLSNFTSRASLLNAVSAYHVGGARNIAAALDALRTSIFVPANGDRPNFPNVAVVILHGTTANPSATLLAASAARAQGITLIVVGVTGNVRQVELEGIASFPTQANIYTVPDYYSFINIESGLADAVCNDKNECSSNPCHNDGVCLDLINGFQCNCSSFYTGLTCDHACSGLTDVIFVVDASDSIRIERYPAVISLLQSVVEQMDIGLGRTRVGAIKFANKASVQFNLNAYSSKQDVIAAIQRISFVGGRTNISGALWQMKDQMFTAANGDRPDARNVAIVVTDGAANIDRDRTIPYAVEARNAGIYIATLAVGSLVDTTMLHAVASPPVEESVFVADWASNLPGFRDRLFMTTCDDSDECSSNPCVNGGQSTNDMHRYSCRCPTGYTGERCERSCSRQMDLTVILDLSGSDEDMFTEMADFADQLVLGLPLDTGATRLAVVIYSDSASISFQLDKYTKREQVRNALSQTFSIVGGRTNTQAALLLTHSIVFNATNGDRPGVPNIALILTDGNSNIQPERTIPEANNARLKGIEVFAVAVGSEVSMAEINGIASTLTNDHVFLLPTPDDSYRAASDVLDRLCR